MMPMYNTRLFSDIWNSVDDFKSDVMSNPLYNIKEESLATLFYHLYAEYGNSPIANLDVMQFKFKIYSTINCYGPAWEKRVEIQNKIRNLTEEELRTGNKVVYNHAYNNGGEPSTSALEEVLAINDQNVTNTKKGRIEALAIQWDMLETDVTREFIGKFKKCFKQFVMPENPILYESED